VLWRRITALLREVPDELILGPVLGTPVRKVRKRSKQIQRTLGEQARRLEHDFAPEWRRPAGSRALR
jgi:hypothetical protein